MSITVKIEYPFGIERIYPACDTSKLLLSLTDNKTFTRNQINKVKQLGYDVNVEQVTL
jgi:hypothetical protein